MLIARHPTPVKLKRQENSVTFVADMINFVVNYCRQVYSMKIVALQKSDRLSGWKKMPAFQRAKSNSPRNQRGRFYYATATRKTLYLHLAFYVMRFNATSIELVHALIVHSISCARKTLTRKFYIYFDSFEHVRGYSIASSHLLDSKLQNHLNISVLTSDLLSR